MTLTIETAQELTERIKAGVEVVWGLVTQAYLDRVWKTLGYSSWDEYCTKEFGSCRLQLPREERQEIVASMRELGMSTRAIAAATGLSVGTVHNEATGVQNRTPDSVVGYDGKAYRSKPVEREPVASLDGGSSEDPADKATPPARRRRPIVEAFDAVRYDLLKRAESLARLAADDRFDRNAEQLAHRYRFDLIQARDAIQAVIDRLPTPTTDSQEG
ncbi:hypothetical protein ACIRRA_13535 [Nocardia sp. NPDC101769]|uniref:hypothetical protein n=1 Tax=Nocardia sp. NPDC101769 TaxID=3364333 RepID=UPI0038025BB9